MEKKIFQLLEIIAFVCAYVLVLRILNITCPIRAITTIPCPGCGSTRAVLSLAKLNFADYFHYNAMAVPAALAVVVFICSDMDIFKKFLTKKVTYAITIPILASDMVYYIYRLIFNLIP